MRETYQYADADPFGTAVAFRQFERLFSQTELKLRKSNAFATLHKHTDSNAVYINISKSFYLGDDERDALLSFAERGNTVFISSENIDTALLRQLHFPQKPFLNGFDNIENFRSTGVQLQPYYFTEPALYSYFFTPLVHSFAMPAGSTTVRQLGMNETINPNFVLVFFGRGRVYLHCEPRTFSNYFLLQQNNYRYLQQVLSLLPVAPETAFWDDYHNKHDTPPAGKAAKSALDTMLQYPAMAAAFWIALGSVAVYLLFGSKRRQRIVPTLKANQNHSIAFTETVSRLYLQSKDNRNIAEKMITYFLDYVRNTWLINTSQLNEDFMLLLSRKSNMPEAETRRLVHLINKIQQSYHPIGDAQLLSLNAQIEKYYKNKP